MNKHNPKIGLFAKLKLRWFLLLRSILHLWVKAKTLPEPFDDLQIDRDKPICYIIDSYSLSFLLILDRACEERHLPRPLWPMETSDGVEQRSRVVGSRGERVESVSLFPEW